MTCRDLDNMLVSHSSLEDMPAEAAAHVKHCARCQELIRAMGTTPEFGTVSSERLQHIESRIIGDLKSTRPSRTPNVIVFLLVLAVVAGVGAALLGTAGWHALNPLQKTAMFSSLAVAAGLLGFSMSRQIVPGRRLTLSPYLLAAVVLAAILSLCDVLFYPHAELTFVATGLVCLRIGVECAASAAVLFWLLMRRGAILKPVLTGLTSGALAGLSGLTVLEIFCPNLNRNHIVVWHLGTVLVSTIVGIVIGLLAERFGWGRTREKTS